MPTYEVRLKLVSYYDTEVYAADEELAQEEALEELYRLKAEDRRYCIQDGDIDVQSVAKVSRYCLPYDEDARHERD